MPDIRLFPLDGGIRRNAEVDDWVRHRPPELRHLAERWLNAMREAGDDVLDLLHDGHPTACVHNLAFGYVDAFRAHVNVGFFLGSSLPDPRHLLQGTGRYMRHVKLRPGLAYDEDALQALVVAAYSDMLARLSGA